MLLSPGRDLENSQMNLLDNMVRSLLIHVLYSQEHLHVCVVNVHLYIIHMYIGFFCVLYIWFSMHCVYVYYVNEIFRNTLYVPRQIMKDGENGSYVVSGFWDVGIAFLSSLNEETPKCKQCFIQRGGLGL